MIKSKKAILMSETVKILVAALAIAILVGLLFKISNSYSTQNKEQIAEENLKNIVSKIDALQVGETTDYLVTGPKDWHFIFSLNVPNLHESEDFFICICDENDFNSCYSQGLCRQTIAITTYEAVVDSFRPLCSFELENLPVKISFTKSNMVFEQEVEPFIEMDIDVQRFITTGCE